MLKQIQTFQTHRTLQTRRVPSTLFLTVISAPSAEVREEVSRHLRYWSYVKFYKYQGRSSLLVCFNLGEINERRQLKKLYTRSRELVLLCLRQYGVTITRWRPLHSNGKSSLNSYLSSYNLIISDETFLRPSSTLRPFIDFIRELNYPSNSSNISNPLKH